MPSFADTLKASADAKQAELASDAVDADEPRTDVTNALTAAAANGLFARLFPDPTDNPPIVLTQPERKWLVTVGKCTITKKGEAYLVSFSKPKRSIEES